MKKHYLIKKIISITFIVLLLIFTPITGFMNGKSAFVYAANLDIMQGASEILAPVAGYLCYQYENVSNTISQIDLSNTIDRVKESIPNVYPRLSNESKFIIASLTTTLNVQDINYTLGTNYSDSTISTFGIETLRLKIENNEPLTLWDMQKLGINDLASFDIKNNLYENNIDISETISFGTDLISTRVIGSQTYYILNQNNKTSYLWDIIPGSVKGSNHLSVEKEGILNYIIAHSTYFININNQYYKLSLNMNLGRFFDQYTNTITNISKNNVIGYPEATSYGSTYNGYSNATLYNMVNGTWTNVYFTSYYHSGSKQALLNTLGSLIGYDFTTTDIYTSSDGLMKYLDTTFDGDNINVGNPDKAFTILAPTAGLLQEYTVSDTSITQAEKVIGNIDAQANPTDLNYEVKAYENNDTNQKEVTLIPDATDVPISDTGSTAIEYPDTTGDTTINEDGTGSLNIPILGSILAWLQKIWQALRDILQTLFDGFNKPTSLDEGIDWGNFTGLFDIFYIFWYLIIIVIMILLKFLAVVFNMLSIPANSSLFSNYPTMLAGLNYIKNIKVGGFNITLQQIFEYMFTVFFFLFIVTTLQKLYHSFAGIERQTINQEQKWDSNSNVIYRDGNYINTKTGEIQDYKYK